jgi:hypothetical protein
MIVPKLRARVLGPEAPSLPSGALRLRVAEYEAILAAYFRQKG